MHDRNIIHRDIKADNVLINDNNEVKIIDFNVSMEVDGSGEVRITNTFVGTKSYAPLELLVPSNETVNGKKVDIWALGVTFYELLLRRHPFNVKSLEELIKIIQQP